MSERARRRPVFCSEADFQHELAIEIRRLNPHQKIRLEYPLGNGQRGAIDVLLQGERTFALELRYLCKGLVIYVDGETFTLSQTSAHDIRRNSVCTNDDRSEHSQTRTGQ